MVKLWAYLVTVEMNKAIELLCAEDKNENFTTIFSEVMEKSHRMDRRRTFYKEIHSELG